MNSDNLTAKYVKSNIITPKNALFAKYVECTSTVRSIDETMMQLNTVDTISNLQDDIK